LYLNIGLNYKNTTFIDIHLDVRMKNMFFLKIKVNSNDNLKDKK